MNVGEIYEKQIASTALESSKRAENASSLGK